MRPVDALPYDLLTPEERRAMMRVGTHTIDGEPLAEWERLWLATRSEVHWSSPAN